MRRRVQGCKGFRARGSGLVSFRDEIDRKRGRAVLG